MKADVNGANTSKPHAPQFTFPTPSFYPSFPPQFTVPSSQFPQLWQMPPHGHLSSHPLSSPTLVQHSFSPYQVPNYPQQLALGIPQFHPAYLHQTSFPQSNHLPHPATGNLVQQDGATLHRDAGLQPQTCGLIQVPHEVAGQLPHVHGQHQTVHSQDAGGQPQTHGLLHLAPPQIDHGYQHQDPLPPFSGHLPKTHPQDPNFLPSSQKWEKVRSKTHGLDYYYNKSTHTTQWTKPDELKVRLFLLSTVLIPIFSRL